MEHRTNHTDICTDEQVSAALGRGKVDTRASPRKTARAPGGHRHRLPVPRRRRFGQILGGVTEGSLRRGTNTHRSLG